MLTDTAPESAAAYSDRCRANYQQGRFDQVIAACSRAIDLDPKAADACLHRGLAFKARGQKPQAVRDLETFLLLTDNPVDLVQVERLINNLKYTARVPGLSRDPMRDVEYWPDKHAA